MEPPLLSGHLYEEGGHGGVVVARHLHTDGRHSEGLRVLVGQQQFVDGAGRMLRGDDLSSKPGVLLPFLPGGGRRGGADQPGVGVLATVDHHELRGERSRGHDSHLGYLTSPGTSGVNRHLELPGNNAERQEEKKAGEEYREEDEEIDVKLILSEENISNNLIRFPGLGAIDEEVEF